MMPNPTKNIDGTLHDIRHPKRAPVATPRIPSRDITPRKSFPIKPVIVGVAVGLFIGGGYFFVQSGAVSNVAQRIGSLSFERQGESTKDDGTLALVGDLLGQFPNLVGNVREVIEAVRGLGKGVEDLDSRGLALIFNGGGEEFLDILKRIHVNIGILTALSIDVPDQLSPINAFTDVGSSGALNDLDSLNDGLGAIISFFDVEGDRRIVLLFENHSEIRPTGGFIGSYAELIVNKGSVESIVVDDIYTPDRNAEYKIIPPVQLQGITTGWGARDANWFFDYPTSADKILELLEASEIYANSGTKFDGAIALNANVVADVLKAVGPIDVPGYGVTVTSENVMLTLREEVEGARDEEPRENPKQILGVIAPIIMERLQDINSEKKRQLIFDLLGRAFSKDIKFYFRDSELQGFIEDTPFSGKVFEIPEVFSGDYLAVVNSNIAGGKSDLFIEQSINLDSRITASGKLNNTLVINRRHFGENEEQPLYSADNQNYIKVFTLPNSVIQSADGITPKVIKPKINYGEAGYAVDSVLDSVESTHVFIPGLNIDKYVESGKSVFGTWFSTPSGETSELKLVYKSEGVLVHEGARFQFVMDKQSGVESALRYRVYAPSGYIWRETNSPMYEQKLDKLINGRLVINLTLTKQE